MLFFKNQKLSKAFFSLSFLLGFTFLLSAQGTAYQIAEGSTTTIKGTSSFHDWAASVGEFSGQLQLSEAFNATKAKALKVEKIALSFQVASMDGGRGAAMNKKIFAALKSTEHPVISFDVAEAQVAAIQKTADGFTLDITGTLKMAGVAKPVSLSLKGMQSADGQLSFAGEYPMKMSTFDIEPPSAMFGQIVTGDDITIVFDLKLAESKN
ncbi:MAG: YceI family protein [Saprospiraceae bacterium]